MSIHFTDLSFQDNWNTSAFFRSVLIKSLQSEALQFITRQHSRVKSAIQRFLIMTGWNHRSVKRTMQVLHDNRLIQLEMYYFH